MLYLSVFREHSLENSDFTKKALIIDGDRPYIMKSEDGWRRTEVGGQRTDIRERKTEDGSRNYSIADFGLKEQRVKMMVDSVEGWIHSTASTQ